MLRRVRRTAAARVLAPLALVTLLVAACGSGTRGPGTVPGSTPRTSAGVQTSSGSPAAPDSTTSTTSPRRLPPGGPVPAGFEPASVTFASASLGYVLGTTAHCASPPCTSLVRTSDGGRSWVGVPAPRAPLDTTASADTSGTSVHGVRFADPIDGWVFGSTLWATHDGARSWHQVPLGGTVLSLEASGGHVDAVVANCTPRNGCSGPARLLQSSTGSDGFAPVATHSSRAASSPFGGLLALHAPAGFADLGMTGEGPGAPSSLVATADGRTWNPMPDPCAGHRGFSLGALAAPDDVTLFSLCLGEGAAGSMDKLVVATSHGHSTAVGAPGRQGDGGQLAAASPSVLALATASGASYLERSVDGGHTWTIVRTYNDGGASFTDLGFTTSTQGVVVHGRPGGPADELLATTDAGASWQHVSF